MGLTWFIAKDMVTVRQTHRTRPMEDKNIEQLLDEVIDFSESN